MHRSKGSFCMYYRTRLNEKIWKEIISILKICTILFAALVVTDTCSAQADVAPWGNITGVRIDGQLFPLQSSLGIARNNWTQISATAHERQRPKYNREGDKQIITTRIDSITFKEVVEDIGSGTIKVDIRSSSTAREALDAAFFRLTLFPKDYNLILVKSLKDRVLKSSIAKLPADFSTEANSIELTSAYSKATLTFPGSTTVIIKKDNNSNDSLYYIYIPLIEGTVTADTSTQKTFTISASGIIDHSPVTFKLNTSIQGRPFDGFGGNFRLQNPKADPQVIDYCLNNMKVAWARVELPWRFWQPQLGEDPLLAAQNSKLNPRVQQAMEMAARLQHMNIPIILSAWFPPQWAVMGQLNMQPVNGVWGNPLDRGKATEIYKSITDYIIYLKNNYHATVSFFSFNESDLGINVRQTGAEHNMLIKGLGAYFKSHGLSTKMLLGDNSDATSYQFIYPAMNDPEAMQYIGAVSFHSWRGWDKATLEKWDSAATVLHKPLIVAEGSIDAAAWNYPAIFEEPSYALQEINLYVRLLSICQPLTILQWQLTSDYSPLAGAGIFGNNDTLHPTQRFWNFKQLASTPRGLFAMPVSQERTDISSAALGDNRKGIYTIHIVNNGASRNAVITGLPSNLSSLNIYVTGKNRSMKKETPVTVVNGKAKFHLDAATFTTLVSNK